jgi:hypothetical protein
MRAEMLNAGWFTSAAGIWRRDDDLERQVRFPVRCLCDRMPSRRAVKAVDD